MDCNEELFLALPRNSRRVILSEINCMKTIVSKASFFARKLFTKCDTQLAKDATGGVIWHIYFASWMHGFKNVKQNVRYRTRAHVVEASRNGMLDRRAHSISAVCHRASGTLWSRLGYAYKL
jgi:hypothetical protein